MSTIHLQCGNCSKTIGIVESSLGKQVRCPYCQQIVQAPAAVSSGEPAASQATAPPGENAELPAPEVRPLSTEEQQRLFGSDSVPAPEPSLQSPAPAPEPAPSPDWLATPHTAPPSAVASEPPPYPESSPAEAPTDSPVTPPWLADGAVSVEAPALAGDSSTQAAPMDEAAIAALATPPPRPKPRTDSVKWLIMLVIPLITYCVLSTILVVYLLAQSRGPSDPFEKMLDQGDPAMPRPDEQLTQKLRRPLGKPIQVGDLEVTADRIQRRAVTLKRNEEVVTKDALVLHLDLKNVGNGKLKPLDYQFERKWNAANSSGSRPYTLVEMGKPIFYGGPLEGPNDPKHQDPAARTSHVELVPKDSDPPEVPTVQDLDRVLEPGESIHTWICTDCEDPRVLQTLDVQTVKKGTYLWRVQVRRGLVRTRTGLFGTGGESRWATAVVGFEFMPSDVKFIK